MDFQKSHADYVVAVQRALSDLSVLDLERVMLAIQATIKKKAAIFICGNGGSSAIASHFVCDYVKGVRTRSGDYPKMFCLNDNVPISTAISNDIGYEEVFSYQLSSLASNEDALLVVSSSGNSPNILKVFLP